MAFVQAVASAEVERGASPGEQSGESRLDDQQQERHRQGASHSFHPVFRFMLRLGLHGSMTGGPGRPGPLHYLA